MDYDFFALENSHVESVAHRNRKKLLFLGGAEFQVPAISCAKKKGYIVITADNNPKNPGHLISDFYENVSTTDHQNILAIAKKYNVDGVMTYASDVATTAVAYVAEQLRLPGSSLHATSVLQRKDLFRQLQKKLGLPYPNFSAVSSLEELKQVFSGFCKRVIIKPADSSGSKGQSTVDSFDQLEAAFAHARSFSRCGLVIVEEYLPSDFLEIVGDALILNGKLAFRHYGHNFFHKNRLNNVPCGEMFPGFFNEDTENEIDAQLEKIINDLKIKNAFVNFDSIVSGGKFYFFEMGLRNGGNYLAELIKYSTGFDFTEAAIALAFNRCKAPLIKCVKNAKPIASYILGSKVSGRFKDYKINEKVKKYVIEAKVFVRENDLVLPFSQGDRALGVIFFEFPSIDVMGEIMKDIENWILLEINQED